MPFDDNPIQYEYGFEVSSHYFLAGFQNLEKSPRIFVQVTCVFPRQYENFVCPSLLMRSKIKEVLRANQESTAIEILSSLIKDQVFDWMNACEPLLLIEIFRICI